MSPRSAVFRDSKPNRRRGLPCGGGALVTSAHYASGEPVPYILDTAGAAPKYVVILFPGGSGNVDPRIENGQLAYGFKGNFLVRSRRFLVDEDFATVTTNSSQGEDRIQAVLRRPEAPLSRGAHLPDGDQQRHRADHAPRGLPLGADRRRIHTSSRGEIYGFDAAGPNRHLVVHHGATPTAPPPSTRPRRRTSASATISSPWKAVSRVGDPCEAFAHHGYNGIERETIDAIKQWIRRGG